jgi:hypothetical protein
MAAALAIRKSLHFIAALFFAFFMIVPPRILRAFELKKLQNLKPLRLQGRFKLHFRNYQTFAASPAESVDRSMD